MQLQTPGGLNEFLRQIVPTALGPISSFDCQQVQLGQQGEGGLLKGVNEEGKEKS